MVGKELHTLAPYDLPEEKQLTLFQGPQIRLAE